MECFAVSIPSSPTASGTKDITKEYNGLRRSNSSRDICNRSTIRRSYSDNHLSYSINNCVQASSAQPKLKNSKSMGIFPFQFSGSIIPNSLRSFLFDQETSKDMNIEEKVMNEEENLVASTEGEEIKRANWVERLMEISSHWRTRQLKETLLADRICNKDTNNECDCDCDCDEYHGVCMVDYSSEDDEEDGQEVTCEREAFSKFLVRVPWSDTKLFSQLAFLCNMAYVIPEIKAKDLRRYYGLQFPSDIHSLEKDVDTEQPIKSVRPSVAYEIAASAASYVQSRAKGLLSLGSKAQKEGGSGDSHGREELRNKEGESSSRVYKSEVAAYVAASTMTAVVAAGEKKKQEAANDLQSLHSSPCEWFVCDESSTYTRCFVIQGSDSLASWQANLFFEPTKFEGTDVLVHRGIYEAAKGIYEQFMPEIMNHLNKYGDRAKLQFTGHSLGGSLSLLVHLMLLNRKVVKPSTICPVITFGSPFVFCRGQKILDELGLDESHICCVMMHRDIVPRAFSCNYPNHVSAVLKRLNGSFRSHPCLIKNKLLYSPVGKLFILQPDERTSPPHPLLPQGSAIYAVDNTKCGYSPGVLRAFLNQPHPLETLSDPTAYGSEGTILRDHDSSNYLKAVNGVLRQHTKLVVRKVRKERNQMWPLLSSPSPHSWSHEKTLESSRLVTRV
ncbi:Lipase [Quillaja saponaria]|uniref:Lipase n=1 Tax=Quillaja saponaria TaxID=32244 RepID=A0AAD7LSE1_QUISA|nr:Lipase [Quillaja saponaria]